MTIEEKFTLQILDRLVNYDGKTVIQLKAFEDLISDVVGVGSPSLQMRTQLEEKGYISISNNFVDKDDGHLYPGLYVTKFGKSTYQELLKKKVSDRMMKIAFWITLIAAVVSAIYGVATFYCIE